MVLAYLPQRMKRQLITNSNYSPQGITGGAPQSLNLMDYPRDWISVDYLQRILLTINTGKVVGVQTDFPLLVDGTFSDLVGLSKSGIAFADIDNVILPHQIQLFDNSTGRLIARVKKQTVADGDEIFMYFDNTISSIPESTETWDENYKAVYKLEPDVLDNIPDSTINDNNGTSTTTPVYEDAVVGKGFRSSSFQMFSAPNSPSVDIGLASFTIELKVETFSAGTNFFGMVEKKVDFNGGLIGFQFWLDFRTAESGLTLRINDGSHPLDTIAVFGDSARAILRNSGTHYVVATYDSATNLIQLYIDAVIGDSTTYTDGIGNFSNTEPLRILGTQNLNALVDEIRLSNINRTADYVTTMNNMESDITSFYTVGIAESVPEVITMVYPIPWLDENYLQRIPLTINAGQVPSTQIDFPLLINGTFPDLIDIPVNELRFAGIDNIQLEYEIELFDSLTGKLVAWVKKPTVKDGDAVFIYFDNPASVDAQNPDAVWSDYSGVYHLSGNFLDSTLNNNDAINNGSTDIIGKIGQARDFDGIDDFLEVANATSLNFDNATLSAWIKSDDNDGLIIAKGTTGSVRGYSIRRNSSLLRFEIGIGVNVLLDGVTPLSDSEFVYVVATYDGVQMKTFVNGVLDTVKNELGNIVGNTINMFIGKIADNTSHFDGIIDEPRISDVIRSDDWIKTEYNNQNNQSTFYLTSPVESFLVQRLLMGYPA